MKIDGKQIANKIAESLKVKVSEFKSSTGRAPKLAIVLVGDDPASKIYVNLKAKKANELGIDLEVRQDLNTDADGIIVQLPGGEKLIPFIPPEKDIDGLLPNSKFLPATVKAVLTVIASVAKQSSNLQDKIASSQAPRNDNKVYVVVGQGRLVGMPLSNYLDSRGINNIKCDESTKNLAEITKTADVLVVATGVENLIKADMVKPGAIVIDCGAPKQEVDFEKVKEVAGAITPVPGGVGPVTVVSLLENLLEASYNTQITHI